MSETEREFLRLIYPEMTELAVASNSVDEILRDATTMIHERDARIAELEDEIRGWKVAYTAVRGSANAADCDLGKKLDDALARCAVAEARVRELEADNLEWELVYHGADRGEARTRYLKERAARRQGEE